MGASRLRALRSAPPLLAVCLSQACAPDVFAVLSVRDPDRVIPRGAELRVGTSSLAEHLETVALEDRALPVTLTLVSQARTSAVVWVEALSSGELLASARVVAQFSEEGPETPVDLRRVCASDLDCDDGRFCNGAERCRESRCVPGPPACPLAIFPCIPMTCAEVDKACVYNPLDLSDANSCTLDGCSGAVVVHVPVADGTPCEAGARGGRCLAGQCAD